SIRLRLRRHPTTVIAFPRGGPIEHHLGARRDRRDLLAQVAQAQRDDREVSAGNRRGEVAALAVEGHSHAHGSRTRSAPGSRSSASARLTSESVNLPCVSTSAWSIPSWARSRAATWSHAIAVAQYNSTSGNSSGPKWPALRELITAFHVEASAVVMSAGGARSPRGKGKVVGNVLRPSPARLPALGRPPGGRWGARRPGRAPPPTALD